MAVLLDSSVLIRHERARGTVTKILAERKDEDEEVFVSVISASELLHSVHRAVDEAVRARRSVWVEAVLEQVALLPIDRATARTHAQIWANLADDGEMIGAHDAWIAASALTHGMTLVTLNPREFRRVAGLDVTTA